MRDLIIAEIRRLAAQAGGTAPGQKLFETATGLGPSKWRGKYWARWGDALVEAGYAPKEWTQKSDPDDLLDGYIRACRHYKRFPSKSDVELLRRNDESIPSPTVVQRAFGSRAGLIEALQSRFENEADFADVLAMLPSKANGRKVETLTSRPSDGHVYLMKSGEYFKIGRTDTLERRFKEITVALPEAVVLIHSITTDDPKGIEAYWHKRFHDRRARGEWFKLSQEDVKAFLRRKFM